jgi:hypothetical protein
MQQLFELVVLQVHFTQVDKPHPLTLEDIQHQPKDLLVLMHITAL